VTYFFRDVVGQAYQVERGIKKEEAINLLKNFYHLENKNGM
jgi:hypothetical protein